MLGESPENEGRVEQPPKRKRLLEALSGVDQGIADMYDGGHDARGGPR